MLDLIYVRKNQIASRFRSSQITFHDGLVDGGLLGVEMRDGRIDAAVEEDADDLLVAPEGGDGEGRVALVIVFV